MKKPILLLVVLAFFALKNRAQTVTDFDGNVYNTVTIGTQVWMKENLKSTHYQNGTAITNVSDGNTWWNLTTEAYCDYDNTAANSTTYGKLYNWFAATNANNICPKGWHIPTEDDWNILEKYIDNTVDITATGTIGTDIGKKMKVAGITLWDSPNEGATNSSGFSALPGGYRGGTGGFSNIKNMANWWSSKELNASDAWMRRLYSDRSTMGRSTYGKNYGFSIRCVRDQLTSQIEEPRIDNDIRVFPNPATDKFVILIPGNQQPRLHIYSMTGESVWSGYLNARENQINISTFVKGVYILQITEPKKIILRKLIKE
jgi:uncharacterized protein (TIGR02145 family)